MADSSDVSTAKPKVEGTIRVIPVGTELPKDANIKLNVASKEPGLVSEDGMIDADNLDSEDIKGWGGQTVLKTPTEKTDDFTFKLFETLDMEVLKFVYSNKNITDAIETGTKVKLTTDFRGPRAVVMGMIMNGGYLKRTVIPKGQLSNLSDIEYVSNGAIGYEVTVSTLPYTEGREQYNHIEYIPKPSKVWETQMTNKSNYIKGIIKSDFRFAADKNRLESYKLFEPVTENESNPMVMPKILVLLLGEKQENNLLNFLCDKKGLVNVKRVEKELTSIFERAKPIEN